MVSPLPKYVDAIRGFPTPRNISNIRSWFGLVNQVSSYGQTRAHMAPFRPFLSPKVKFKWDGEMQRAFEEGKDAIIGAIRDSVHIFDPNLHTCVRTDWSKVVRLLVDQPQLLRRRVAHL